MTDPPSDGGQPCPSSSQESSRTSDPWLIYGKFCLDVRTPEVEAFVTEHNKLLNKLLFRAGVMNEADRKDLIQMTWLNAIKKPRCSENGSAFTTFLIGVARKELPNYWRRRRTLDRMNEPDLHGAADAGPYAQRDLPVSALSAALERALDTLNDEDRKFADMVGQGCSWSVIAAATRRTTPAAARMYWKRSLGVRLSARVRRFSKEEEL